MDPDDTSTSMNTPAKKNGVKSTNQQGKMKPIFATGIGAEEVQRILSKDSLKTQGTFKHVNGNYRLFTSNIEDKKKVMEHFKSRNIPHHSYGEPDERNLTFVLRGHHINDPKLIQQQHPVGQRRPHLEQPEPDKPAFRCAFQQRHNHVRRPRATTQSRGQLED